ncbi:MAG: alpha/beta hydrolase [Planctomycetia bacterium]|nr:alpha/beta hydrolase [Planctomycetia bacterium]
MNVQLVRVLASDGVRLDGAVLPREDARAAAVLVHGTGSNFYGSALFDALGETLAQAGFTVIRVNTRGHDLVSSDAGRRFGAAYESVGDCRHDLAAWADYAQTLAPRVVLVGHSLGAVKCLYAQAHAAHAAVRAVVAISPPRLGYRWFQAHSPDFVANYQRALTLVEAGQGDTLLDLRFPLPFLCTAAGYIEKYGPEERYDFLGLLPRVVVPTLVTLGQKEMASNIAFTGSDDAAKAACPRTRVETIAGADHNYTGTRSALGAAILRWLDTVELGGELR